MWGLIAIVLLILKWIGILLLAVIGIILAVAACILFVPVRYHVYIEKRGQFLVRGYASWLLHCLHLSFQVKDGKESHVPRIFGIPIAGGKKGKKKQTGKKSRGEGQGKSRQKKLEDMKQDSRKDSGNAPEESRKDSGGGGNAPEENREDSEGGGNAPEKSRKDNEDSGNAPEERQKDRKRRKDLHHGKILQKIQEFFLRIGRILSKIRKGFGVFWKSLKSLMEGDDRESDSIVAKARTVLSDKNTLRLWRLVWGNLSTLWRHSKPRKFVGWIHFGASDPCVTGQILGAVGAAYGLIGSGVRVVPDFEQAVLEGCLEMKGRIRMIHLLLIWKRVFFSGEWKHFKGQIG